MRRDLLGPDRERGALPGRLRGDLDAVVADLVSAARYVARHRGPAGALGATGAAKFLFGILSVLTVLLYRNYFYPQSAPVAEGHVAVLAAVSAIGYGCAALVIPPATRWLDKRTVITLLLTASALVVAVLGESFDEIAYLAFGFFIYLALQGVAICVVTVLQEEVDDAYRGRLFAFYDVIFNVSLAAGALLSAAFLPLDGRSPVVVGVVAAGYAVAAAGYWLFSRQSPAASPGGPGTSKPSPAAQSSSS